MQKNGKNKAKDNIWLKQGAFFILVIAWIMAIYFKHELTGLGAAFVFILLLLATFGVVVWLNRAFVGLTAIKEAPKEETEAEEKK